MQEQKQLNVARRIFTWNKCVLTVLGLWPANTSDFRFIFAFGYFVYHMCLEYVDLFLHFNNLEHVVMNLTENLAFTPIVSRMLMLRIYNNKLGVVIKDCMSDYDIHKYKNAKETKTFLSYNATAKNFYKLMTLHVTLTAFSYFLKPLLGQTDCVMEKPVNGSESCMFELPYRFYLLYEVNDKSTYYWTYGSWVPFVLISDFGTIASDCLMITLVYHLSGQMAVLALRIQELPTSDTSQSRKVVHDIVNYHVRLLRSLGHMIEKSFSITLLVYLLCATIAICILGFQIITNFSSGENAIVVTFLVFIALILLILFAQCVVGERLITESTRVSQAFYHCEWYKMPEANAKCILTCIARAQRPLRLTAGDFGTFYISTMTDVIKTSMSYLSVLRNFL